ncbi:MAG TPA: fused MFS/spermidine synthase [Candidatus Polarisedimenticolia bacterium]|jgi:spermidine synthase|nr:fused MFS/spermidine synthase [Candidatus Polarisedimenticolia bacterium]
MSLPIQQHPLQAAPPAPTRLVSICLFLSGASGLIYEVSWARALELLFGSTTYAVATVLAAFMGGLALGSWWMGARAHTFVRLGPLGLYAALETALAVVASCVPVLLKAQGALVRTLPQWIGDSFVATSAVRLVLCFLLLLLPTALMGATLPAISNLVARRGEATGRSVGVLYAINTLGGVMGCAAAGLLLLPRFGLLRTQLVAVGINLGVGCVAFLMMRRGRRSASLPMGQAEMRVDDVGAAATSVADGRGVRAITGLSIAAYALSGLTAIVYEVAWNRLLVLVLGSSTYAYTIMLATFLLGLGVGGWIGARVLQPGVTPLVAIGLCQTVVAISTWASLFLVDELPFFYVVALGHLPPSPHGVLGVQWGLAAVLMVLPTMGLGAMFPAIVGALDPEGLRASRTVGRAIAWNTLGAILGSIAAGFWLVPRLGTGPTLRSGILVNAIVAMIVFVAARSEAGPALRFATTLALLVFAANVMILAPRWRPDILSSGVFRYAKEYLGLDRAAFRQKARTHAGDILMFEEGLTCTVQVIRTTPLLALQINGKPDASVPSGLTDPYARTIPAVLGDLPTQVLMAHLPLMLAKTSDRVLVVGLGSGVTLGSVLKHPVRHVECIEIEDAVVRASRFFDAQSGSPLLDPRVHLVLNDARTRLALPGPAFDVIISEPSNPWTAGSASLFTTDFFSIARRRLSPGGVFGQWVQLYELDAKDLLTLLRSFIAVFPHAQLFRVGGDAIILGSDRSFSLDMRRILVRAGSAVRADLARVGVDGPEDIVARWWNGGEALRRAIPSGDLNTDDNMLIEFVAPLRVLARGVSGASLADPGALFPDGAHALAEHLLLGDADNRERAAVWARIAAARLALRDTDTALAFAERSLDVEDTAAGWRVYGDALRAAGRPDEALNRWEVAARLYPTDAGLQRALANLFEERADWPALRHRAVELARLDPSDRHAQYLFGKALHHLGDNRGALEALKPLCGSAESSGTNPPVDPCSGDDPANPDLGLLFGSVSIGNALYDQAVDSLRSYLRNKPSDKEARALLVDALRRLGRLDEAEVESRRLVPDASERATAALLAGKEAWRAGDLAQTRDRVEEAWQFNPEDDSVAFTLARIRARSGDVDGAIAAVEQFLTMQADHPWAVGYLGQLLEETGHVDAARLMATRYRSLMGDDWQPVDRDAAPLPQRVPSLGVSRPQSDPPPASLSQR